MRTWTDEEVASYKTHTEEQLRAIIKDRDDTIEKLEKLTQDLAGRITELKNSTIPKPVPE
jgi:hypothetical protein